MSGFAVVYERSNTPVQPGVFDRVMGRLSHRGPDGQNISVIDRVQMGHWHFWTTPEDVGENQPLSIPDLPYVIVLDGRIDNRNELFDALGFEKDRRSISDAALVLWAYARWGESSFARFVGEFALVIYDSKDQKVICVRDAIGTRALYYAWNGTKLIVASEPWAVAGGFPITPKLNERAAAHYFAMRAPEDGQTLFDGIYALLPGHYAVIRDAHCIFSCYWAPDVERKVRYRTDTEYAEHFRDLLTTSVACRMRSTTPVGVMMSGGLDSTSIACLAAQMIAPRQLTTLSYVFEQFPECDERKYIDAVASAYDMHSSQIPCDDLYSFYDWPRWVEYFNYPVVNLYKGMRERMYQEAHRQGIRVLLTGDFGDHLYNGSENFLSDLLFDGQFGDFIDEIIFYFRKPERRSALKNQYLRQLGKRILFGLPFDVSSLRSNSCPEWLTPLAAEHLTYETSKQSFYLSRMKGVMGLLWAQNDAMSFTSKFNVELRYPYRDRRIIDFVLAIPAYQLYRHGITRLILRNAMRDIFPDILRNRIGKTTLITMLFHGMSDKREDLQAFFSESDTIWQKYVNQVWLLERWDKIFSSTQDGADKIVPWLCIAFLLWYKQVDFSCNKT